MKRLLALALCLLMLPFTVLAEPITPDEDETGSVPWEDEVVEKTLVAIEVTAPTKTEYFVGDILDTDGMTVTAVYNNGDEEDVTAEASVDITTLDTAGTVTVTVTYEGKTDTFEVNAVALVVEKIEVTAPAKAVYKVGETLDTTGMVVIATYNNGSTADVTTDAIASPATLTEIGTTTITVTYEGKNKTFDVRVYVPGDITGDGKVNSRDITRLKQYVAGGYDITYVEEALDTNGDGKVNSRDITRLKQVVAGGYGVEAH